MKIQKRTNKLTFLETIYHLHPLYINVIHKDGRKKRTNIYALMYYATRKTLSRATTKRAMELYDGRFHNAVDDWQDLLSTSAVNSLYGYTDNKGNYHKGYYTDKMATVTAIMATAYSAVNAVLYASNAAGRHAGKVVLTDDYKVVTDVTNIFGYVVSGRTTVNAKKYAVLIEDVRKLLKTSYLKVFDCIIENDYTNTDGTIPSALIADVLGISDRTARRALSAVKDSVRIIVSNYNMTASQFVAYLQKA